MVRGSGAVVAPVAIVGVLFVGRAMVDGAVATVLPGIQPREVALFDATAIPITTTVLWHKVPRMVTAHDLLNNQTLWRRMHFGDWDRVDRPLRERALSRMLLRYSYVLDGPDAWSQMSIFDWDNVPQPIRAFTYQRMVAHWTSHYDVGAGYAESPSVAAETVSAIVMAESWFEHRGISVSDWGNRDIGLAACSNHCREVLAELAGDGLVDFQLDDHEYFHPWNGARVAAFWFGRELARAEGDFDLAIAAYHRGFEAARRGAGQDYASNVRRLLRRYIRAEEAPPTWTYLSEAIPLQPVFSRETAAVPPPEDRAGV